MIDGTETPLEYASTVADRGQSRQGLVIAQVEKVARILAIGVVLAAAAQAVYAVRGLYADGSYYLWNILQSQTFFLYPSRWVAQVVTQFPLVAAINLGVNDVSVLARLHSLGTAALPMVVWACALVVLLRHRAFWPFVTIFAFTFLNSGYIAAGEYTFAHAFVALSAALLLRGNFNEASRVCLLISSALLPFSYETLVFLGPLLALLALVRLRPLLPDWRSRGSEVVTFVVVILLDLTAAGVGLRWILFPRDAANLAGASNLLWPIENDKQLVWSGAIAVGYLLVLLVGGPRLQRYATVLLVAACAVLLAPSMWNVPWMQYASRTITGLALFPLLVVSVVISLVAERRAAMGRQERSGSRGYWLVSAALLATQLVPFTVHTYGYGQWLASFENAVTTSSGIRTNDQTVLQFKDTSFYVWPWTNPFLSLLLQTSDGQAMILSPGVTTPKDGSLPAPLPSRYYKHGSLFGG